MIDPTDEEIEVLREYLSRPGTPEPGSARIRKLLAAYERQREALRILSGLVCSCSGPVFGDPIPCVRHIARAALGGGDG